MGRKQKWEKEFEAYDVMAETKKINELTRKFEDKSISKQEYEELKKSIAKYDNIKKVSNIIEVKKQLEADREKINKKIEEIKKYQKNEESNKKILEENKKLEEELNKIQEELSEVSNKLKENNLSEDERKKLENKKSELIEKKDKNNEKFVENQGKISTDTENKEIKDIKELEDEKNDIGKKISDCCFVGRLLMDGKNWEYIEVKYEQKMQKYTDKDNSLSSKVDSQRRIQKEEKNEGKEEVDETIKETEKEIGKEVEKINNEESKIDSEKEEETVALTEQTEFQRKHPRLAKIFDSIKNLFNRKNSLKKEMQYESIIKEEIPEEVIKKEIDVEPKEVVNKEIEKEETLKEETKVEKTQRDEFLDYLKVVSEKGIDQVKKDVAKQKFEENKKAAYARETEKFGKEYAEMSYKEERD